MLYVRRAGLWMVCVLIALGVSACSKKKEEAKAPEGKTLSERVANETPPPAVVTKENAPFRAEITGKGFEIAQAKRFPAQVDARRAAVVVYNSGGNKGGVLYVRGFETEAQRPVWHWYFNDTAPDSITAMDINRDGLWDVRVFMAGGKTNDYLQETDFSFMGAEHDGLFANNGASSNTKDLWKAFDADSSTSWTSPANGAYIDIPNPLGLEVGQLTVREAGGSRPTKLEIGDGTNKLQDVDLESTAEEQRFQLDAAVKALPVIRVTVVGKGKNVALSELGIH